MLEHYCTFFYSYTYNTIIDIRIKTYKHQQKIISRKNKEDRSNCHQKLKIIQHQKESFFRSKNQLIVC